MQKRKRQRIWTAYLVMVVHASEISPATVSSNFNQSLFFFKKEKRRGEYETNTSCNYGE